MADKIFAVIGAGGKTSFIHLLAEHYRKAGKKVLVTTTTHMYREADTDLSCDRELITERLMKEGYCMAGALCSKDLDKIESLPEELFASLCKAADIVLVEADGAKRYPAKYPNEREPVIPKECTDIILLMGMAACGKKVKETVFRSELLKKQTGISGETLVTRDLLIRIMKEAYLPRLALLCPQAKLHCYLTANHTYESVIL